MSNYVTEYVPDKWKNLRLEYTDEYIDSLKKQKIHEPKIMKKPVKSTNPVKSPHPVKSTNPVKSPHPIKHEKPVSVLKNKSDVNKESHKLCEGEQCINKNNNKCVIL
tara:strand:+ start:1808 stop:2128 length:321 start_codon:yes stop_codon:yes gene_type:complete